MVIRFRHFRAAQADNVRVRIRPFHGAWRELASVSIVIEDMTGRSGATGIKHWYRTTCLGRQDLTRIVSCSTSTERGFKAHGTIARHGPASGWGLVEIRVTCSDRVCLGVI